jgi:hypothetical protein
VKGGEQIVGERHLEFKIKSKKPLKQVTLEYSSFIRSWIHWS